MGYREAMEAAGAKVLAFEEFGDYQGSWIAKVEYKGEVGWVEGNYGSCSGCDAFQGEFDDWFDDEPETRPQRLAEFGKSYLETIYSQELQEAKIQRMKDEEGVDGWYYDDYKAMLNFVKESA